MKGPQPFRSAGNGWGTSGGCPQSRPLKSGGALFRQISQKSSLIHQVLPAVFASVAGKIALVFYGPLFVTPQVEQKKRHIRKNVDNGGKGLDDLNEHKSAFCGPAAGKTLGGKARARSFFPGRDAPLLGRFLLL